MDSIFRVLLVLAETNRVSTGNNLGYLWHVQAIPAPSSIRNANSYRTCSIQAVPPIDSVHGRGSTSVDDIAGQVMDYLIGEIVHGHIDAAYKKVELKY